MEKIEPGIREMNFDEQQEWVSTIFDNLQEGIIVCNTDGRIAVANQSAKRFFPNTNKLAKGQSLYEICMEESVRQTLAFLHRQQSEELQMETSRGEYHFACAIAERGALINCRLLLLSRASTNFGFVLFFDISSHEREVLLKRYTPLCSSVEDLRAPLANLRAAAENLVMHTDMAPVMRSAFENIIAQESLTLTEQFEALAAESRSQALQQSCHVDIYSADLTSCLQYRCIDTGTSLTETAPPLWIHADSLLLLPALDFLLHRILDFSSASQVNIEVIRRDAKMYLDLIWQGDPVPAAEIESWRDQSLADMSAGNITMAEVLERHNSDIWSKRYSRPGWSLVRMPLPISSRR